MILHILQNFIFKKNYGLQSLEGTGLITKGYLKLHLQAYKKRFKDYAVFLPGTLFDH